MEKTKWQFKDWETIFANHISYQGRESLLDTEFSNLKNYFKVNDNMNRPEQAFYQGRHTFMQIRT